MNFTLRLKNKATLTALIAAAVAFVYQILGIVGVVPAISQNDITQLIGIVINLLAALGIVVDPTTAGVSDHYLDNPSTRPGSIAHTEMDTDFAKTDDDLKKMGGAE